MIGFRGLSLRDPDREALEVLTQVLSGQGGRLFLELRDRRSLAYSVSALNVEGVAPGLFAVYIATSPDKLADAELGMRSELERLLGEAPSEGELERARRYLIGNFAIDQQRAAVRAEPRRPRRPLRPRPRLRPPLPRAHRAPSPATTSCASPAASSTSTPPPARPSAPAIRGRSTST